MKKATYIFLILSTSFAYGQGIKRAKNLDYRLIIQQETSYDFSYGGLQKSEWLFDSEASLRINDKIKFFGQLRLYTELTDRLDPGKPNFNNYSKFSKPLVLGDRTQLELRELYADIKLGKTYWRLGKQQIVLGQTEGLKVLDVLNPMTFREFILDDFEDSRIPLWSVKGDIPVGIFKLEAFWIPDLTYHHFPGAGGMYSPEIIPANSSTDVGMKVLHEDKPNNMIRDSDLGARVSTFWNGWDLSISYVYQYDNMPVISSWFDAHDQLIMLQPTYKRTHMVGTTIGNTIGSFGIRGEVGYLPNKHYAVPNIIGVDGLRKTHQVISGIGIDYFGISETLITLQWFGDWINFKDDHGAQSRENMTNTVTLMATRSFMNQRIEGRIFNVYSMDEQNGIIDLKLSYLMQDNFKVWLGGNAFIGGGQGIIGQFSHRNRISIGAEFGLQSK